MARRGIDILIQIRTAFLGEDKVLKNIVLRKASDEIEQLRKEHTRLVNELRAAKEAKP